jgi:hypothetical protein
LLSETLLTPTEATRSSPTATLRRGDDSKTALVLRPAITNTTATAHPATLDILAQQLVTQGYGESVNRKVRLHLLKCEDVSWNVAKVAEARWAAPERPIVDLCEIEGHPAYERQQEFLAVAARLVREASCTFPRPLQTSDSVTMIGLG